MLNDDAKMYDNYIPLCSDARARNASSSCEGCGAMGEGGCFRESPGTHDPAKTAWVLATWEEAVKRFHRPDEGVEIVIGPVRAVRPRPSALRCVDACRSCAGHGLQR